MKRWIALAAVMLIVAVMIPTAVSAASPQTITDISFSNGSAVAEENLSLSGYGDKDSGYAPSTNGGRVFASVSGTDYRKLEWSKGEYAEVGMQPVMTGGTKNPWGNGAYLELRVSTKGYENITFTADIGATNKGPRDYKLQYSTDGETFQDIAGTLFTVSVNKTMFTAFDKVALPADADNADMLYIRIVVATNMMVNGTAGLIGTTGGETAINNIVVAGTPIKETTTTQAATETTTVKTTVTSAEDTTVNVTTTVAQAQNAVDNVNTGDSSHAVFAFMAAAVGLLAITVARRVTR